MAKQFFPVPSFGGLVLDREVDEVGANGCIDALDIDLDRRGAVRSRDGVSKFNAVASTSNLIGAAIWQNDGLGNQYVIVNALDGSFRAYTSAGVLSATSGNITGTAPVSAASLGTGSTGPYIYLATSSSAVRRFDGTTFTSPVGQPGARFLTVMPGDNRLVAAGVTGPPSGSTAAAGSMSLVHFSDPGAPETWTASSWEYLTPHDGENISGAVTFNNQTIVFKQSRFFVFWGNSTDADGNPVFNYRTVDTGIGAMQPTVGQNSCCATAEGVYFVGRRGVYLTTGGPPKKISAALDPVFNGVGSSWFQSGDALNAAFGVGSVCEYGDRLLVTLHLITAGWITFVYYRSSGEWGVWQPAQPMVWVAGVLQSTTSAKLLWAATSSPTSSAAVPNIYALDPTVTTDDGTAITSRYRSGFYTSIGNPAQECTVRESIIDGIGAPVFSVSRDFATTLPTSAGGAKAAATLGGVTPAQGRHRVSQRGRRFSYQIETPSVTDSFATDSSANYTADAGALTNVSITGGVMQAVANLSTANRFVRTSGVSAINFFNAQATVKATLGTTLSGWIHGVILKYVDTNNFVATYVDDDGSNSKLWVWQNVAGSSTFTSVATLTRLTISTAYWIRSRMDGNNVYAEHWTAAPSSSGTAASAPAAVTLAGAAATALGSGVAGKVGVIFLPKQAAASVDDFSVVGGPWRVESITQTLTGVRDPGLKTT